MTPSLVTTYYTHESLLAQGTDPSCQSTSRPCPPDPSTPPRRIPTTELRDPQVVAYHNVPHIVHDTLKTGYWNGLMIDGMQGLALHPGGFDNLPANLLLCEGWVLGGCVTGCRAFHTLAPNRGNAYVRFRNLELSFHFPNLSLQDCSQPANRAPKGTKALLMRSKLDSLWWSFS